MISTRIDAPQQRCFDLARDVEAHLRSAANTGERIVAGRTTGLLELDDELTFEARHFGVTQRLSSRISVLEPYSYFQDRMTRGAFKSLVHDHRFERIDQGGTLMTDIVSFEAPFGPFGWAAERLLLAPHLRNFLRVRGLALKAMAENKDGSPTL